MRGAGDLEALSGHARVERYWARAPAWIRLIRRRWRDRVVETVDHAGVIVAVRDTGGLTHRYILMTIASAGIAILGLFQSSPAAQPRSEEHTSELQSLIRIPYAVFWLKKENNAWMYHHEHSANGVASEQGYVHRR